MFFNITHSLTIFQTIIDDILKPYFKGYYNFILKWYPDFYLDTKRTLQNSSQGFESSSIAQILLLPKKIWVWQVLHWVFKSGYFQRLSQDKPCKGL